MNTGYEVICYQGALIHHSPEYTLCPILNILDTLKLSHTANFFSLKASFYRLRWLVRPTFLNLIFIRRDDIEEKKSKSFDWSMLCACAFPIICKVSPPTKHYLYIWPILISTSQFIYKHQYANHQYANISKSASLWSDISLNFRQKGFILEICYNYENARSVITGDSL